MIDPRVRKSPVINRQSPTAPVLSVTPPSTAFSYSDGRQGDVSGGPFGGFNPPPVLSGYDAGNYDAGTYDS